MDEKIESMKEQLRAYYTTYEINFVRRNPNNDDYYFNASNSEGKQIELRVKVTGRIFYRNRDKWKVMNDIMLDVTD